MFQNVAEEAFTLAELLADQGRASRACRMALAAINRYGAATMFGTVETHQWAGRADQYAEPGTIDRVHADVALGSVQIAAGRPAEARALRLRALELAQRLDDPETLFTVASRTIASTPTAPHQEEELWRLVREVAERPTTGVSAATLGFRQFYSGAYALSWGERSHAEHLWRQVMEAGERTGDATLRVRASFTEVAVAGLDGRLEEAVALAERLVVLADELGSPVAGRQYAGLGTFRPLIYMGRAEEVLAAMPQAVQLAGGDELASRAAMRAALLSHLGRIAEAQEGLKEFGPYGLEDATPTRMLVTLLEAAVLVEDRIAASLLAERLVPAANLSTVIVAATCPARHLGGAAALLGEPDKARKYYYQALEAAGKIHFRPEIALTRLQLCELLLDHYSERAGPRRWSTWTSPSASSGT